MSALQHVINHLDAVSRQRALSYWESRCLAAAIKGERSSANRRAYGNWTDRDDAIARNMRANGAGPAAIGAELGRSANAVTARLRYLRARAAQ